MKKQMISILILAVALSACGSQGLDRQAGIAATRTARAEAGSAGRTPTATASVTPSPVPPTATPSPTLTPTATAYSFPVVTFSQNANCRLGPATGYYAVDVFEAGQSAQANGRSEDGKWINLQAPDKSYCWTTASALQDFGPVDALRVLEAQALPAIPWGFNVSNMVCSGVLAVHLEWETDQSASGYRLYRDGKEIAELGPGRGSYIDQPPPRKSYVYEVQAVNGLGTSSRVSLAQTGCP